MENLESAQEMMHPRLVDKYFLNSKLKGRTNMQNLCPILKTNSLIQIKEIDLKVISTWMNFENERF